MEEPSRHTANFKPFSMSAARMALGYECAACRSFSLPGARFCAACGARLTQRCTAPAEEPAGTCCQATVLFADIADSTEQIAQLAPQQAMRRLQPAITLMCEVVERYRGTVMRTLGDGVMALFGAPTALETHARLACEAALQMQEEFARADSGLSIRVGLHSGWVACDAHSHHGRTGGLAHGLTMHLASRVHGLAVPGGVAITRDCHSLVNGQVDVESIGPRQLKGVPHPVEIFKLGGFRATSGAERGYTRAAARAAKSGSASMRS